MTETEKETKETTEIVTDALGNIELKSRPLPGAVKTALEVISEHALTEEEAMAWVSWYMAVKKDPEAEMVLVRRARGMLAVAKAARESPKAVWPKLDS